MYSELKSLGADLLSVAVDLQGPDKPRPYVEAAKAEFNTVVDQENVLGGIFGYRAIPNGLFIDADGTLLFRRLSGFDVKKPEVAAEVLKFASGVDSAGGESSATAVFGDFFARGLTMYQAGDTDGASTVWREGIAVEPDHWNMRKQLWAIEHPERFYDGAVDYGWQKEQVEQGL